MKDQTNGRIIMMPVAHLYYYIIITLLLNLRRRRPLSRQDGKLSVFSLSLPPCALDTLKAITPITCADQILFLMTRQGREALTVLALDFPDLIKPHERDKARAQVDNIAFF